MITSSPCRIESPDDHWLPVHLEVRVRSPSHSIIDSPQALQQLARVQAVASVISIVAIVAFVFSGHWIDIRVHLPRLFALLATGIVTERAFTTPDRFCTKSRDQSIIRRISIVLQAFWVLSELAFASAFAPLLIVADPSFPFTTAGSVALHVLPLCSMVSLAGFIDYFTKLRQRKRQRRLSSGPSGDLSRYSSSTTTANFTAVHSNHPYHEQPSSDDFSTPPLSPADSLVSESSGSLASGLPSPTGHCPSPDRTAMLRHAGCKSLPPSCDIYLIYYTLDTNESVLFVHKKLRPIRTKIQDPPPMAKQGPDYKQLMRQLEAKSKYPSRPCPPLAMPTVVATISVAKGKEQQHPRVPAMRAVPLL